jgi:hypothetical protein
MNVGPTPLRDGGSVLSGAVSSIAVDPSDLSHWLIGANSGGVWETRDAGTTWAPKTDDQASLVMGAVAFAPGNPNIVYAGTGGGEPLLLFGVGLLKSMNGGTTWQLIATSPFANNAFKELKVHPTNSDVVIAATNTEAFAGEDHNAGPPTRPPSGILKSTDGGKVWSSRLVGDAMALQVAANDFSHQYAGLGTRSGSPVNGVYRSLDGGDTWTAINGPWTSLIGLGKVALASAPSDPNVLYVIIVGAWTPQPKPLLGLWRTDNAWAPIPSWNALALPPGDTTKWGLTNALSVDPANANTLYSGGDRLWRFDGTVWTAADLGFGDYHTLTWAGNRLIAGNDGGVWSRVSGASSQSHNTNLSTIQFYAGSLHPTDPSFALGASQDHGTEKWTGTNAWQTVFEGDGGPNAISATNPNKDWAVSFQQVGLSRTTDGGNSFVAADGGIDKTAALTFPPLKKCAANDDVFILGTLNLWKSMNFFSGSTASWFANGPENEPFPLSTITAVAFAESDHTCSIYAFGDYVGHLRLTMNGGRTWTDINAAGSVPSRFISELVFDPTDADVLYVTLSGFDEGTPNRPGHVFKTTNALSGAPIWQNISPPVNLPQNTIAIDSTDPRTIFVGSDIGVWYSVDDGVSWVHMGPEVGMPNVPVYDLKINATTGRIVAFTGGRGAFAFVRGQQLAAAVLPSSRSVQVGTTATAFVSIVNAGVSTAVAVSISPSATLPATFTYQTTNPVTNEVTGTPNTAVDIGPGQFQTYVIALTPTTPFGPTDVAFAFAGSNTTPVATLVGINTLLLSASATPVPDLVALAASATPGVVDIAGATGAGAFAVATVNVGGTAGQIAVSADTGGTSLPVVASLCQTNPATGTCLGTPDSSVNIPISTGQTPTFAIFVQGNGVVPFDPANNRIFVRFKDANGVTRGATSVAVRTKF